MPGARLEEGDIVAAGDRGQVHLEFAAGSLVNLVGAGTLYASRPPRSRSSPAGAPTLVVPSGWLKVAAKAPGLQVRVASAEIAIAAGAVVMRTDGTTLDIFIESGSARITELAPSGAEQTAREAKHDEYWSRSATGAFVAVDAAAEGVRRGHAATFFGCAAELREQVQDPAGAGGRP